MWSTPYGGEWDGKRNHEQTRPTRMLHQRSPLRVDDRRIAWRSIPPLAWEKT